MSNAIKIVLCAFLIPALSWSQEHHAYTKLKAWDLHLRNYQMYTQNKETPAYFGNATALKLTYHKKVNQKWLLGLGGLAIIPTGYSTRNSKNNALGNTSKWERELYFQNDRSARLETAFIQRNFNRAILGYGIQEFEKTPLINSSDGRTSGYRFHGLKTEITPWDKTKFYAYWIQAVSPRSQSNWYQISTAFGSNSMGFQPNGALANYQNSTHSKGIGIIGIKQNIGQQLNVQAWNLHLDQVINTSWLQLDYQWNAWQLGAIYSFQIPASKQSKLPYNQRYVQPFENGQVASFKIAWQDPNFELGAFYTRAFDSGRYLFPRELGRDQFYTSFSRNRLEGFSNMEVFAVKAKYRFNTENFLVGVSAASLNGVRVGALQNNKYNLDEYNQINTKLQYEFKNIAQGLQVQLLYVWKENKNKHDLATVFNQSDFNQINLITNIYF